MVEMVVSFQWKNPDFSMKNPDFLLKNVDFITKQGGHAELVTDPAEIKPALRRALASGKPSPRCFH